MRRVQSNGINHLRDFLIACVPSELQLTAKNQHRTGTLVPAIERHALRMPHIKLYIGIPRPDSRLR